MDSTKLRSLGWMPTIRLEDGLKATCAWFINHQNLFNDQ